jgi:hypothetical protein
MRIPSSFKLMGHTVTVDLIPPIKWKRKDACGWFDPNKLHIEVLKRPGTITEQTFLHELMHAVFYALNHPLYQNEELVDQIGGLLHQAIKTAKYPRQPRRSRKAKT